MRHFYYFESGIDHNKIFEYLDNQVDEGYIDYSVDESDGIIKIKNINVEDDDDIYKMFDKWGLIEDIDVEIIDEDFDDFYNEEDYESN